MSDTPQKVNAKEIAKVFAEKFKNMPKDGNLPQNIPDIIWEVLNSHGIEIPEKVKQAIKNYQPKQ